jgi:glycosyltransferase involved in cell wall biosynthesis
MRILHLGFEDHRRPGSGGGSLRNHEVNRRLVSRGHEVEVLTARYAGARARHEDGVSYRPIGLGLEYFTSLIAYQALLPGVVLSAAAHRLRPDLLVEEFVPPCSTLGLGRLTSIPTVGSVQGYFAEEKARQYHLPRSALVGVQRWGTRAHRHLIAASQDLGARLQQDAPRAEVSIIPLGVAHEEIAGSLDPLPASASRQIVYLGRLETSQKGLDLLIRACDGLLAAEDARLVVAGDGHDARAIRALAAASLDGDRIDFRGRVDGADKWRLLAASQICAMPSRYETFGLTALEALACGTPVVGFDIESLRETVGGGTAVLVPPFEVVALRAALRSLLRDPGTCAAMGARGRSHAAGYSWGSVAEAQEQVYLSALAG